MQIPFKNEVKPIRHIFIFSILAIISKSTGNPEFFHPWTDSSKPIIIDPYQYNSINWNQLKRDTRVVAIIHRATHGFRTDSVYVERKQKAKALGYKWGSYHLGTKNNPAGQADFYLKVVGSNNDETLALDLEDTTKYMNLNGAKLFVERIFEKTGRYPLLYCNRILLSSIVNQKEKNKIFGNCGLWYARFKDSITDFTPTLWKSYTIWQFSSEINCRKKGTCPYNVPGVESDMDINVYNGSKSELVKNWPNIAVR